MTASKKGFVLYFDQKPCLDSLSAEQRGYLLSALMQYAQEVAEWDTSVEAVMAEYPQLLPEAQMAMRFLCGTVLRDTEKWQERQRNYLKAAQVRKARSWSASQREELSGLPETAFRM